MYFIITCVKIFRIFDVVVWRLAAIKCPIMLGILPFTLLLLKFAERKVRKLLVVCLKYIFLYIFFPSTFS